MTDPPGTTQLLRLLPLLALLAGCSQDSLVHTSSFWLEVEVAAADAVDGTVCGRSLSIEDETSGRFERALPEPSGVEPPCIPQNLARRAGAPMGYPFERVAWLT